MSAKKDPTKKYIIVHGTLIRGGETKGPGDTVELTAKSAKNYGLSRLKSAEPEPAPVDDLAARTAALDARETELAKREAEVEAREKAAADPKLKTSEAPAAKTEPAKDGQPWADKETAKK